MTAFDLDNAISDAVAAHELAVSHIRAQRQAEQEAEERRKADSQAQAIKTCTERLLEDLGEELYKALSISVVWDTYAPQATAIVDEQPWTISYSTPGDGYFWHIALPLGPGGSCVREALRSVVLRCIAQERELNREQQATQARREAERQAQQAEHERCLSLLTAALDAARSELWTWPAGQILTLYHWSWYIGGNEWESAWSATDVLDDQGYVMLYTDPTGSTLRLDLLAHRPVIERRIFGAIDELPSYLHEQVRIEVRGIWYNHTLEQYRAYDDSAMWHEVGVIPCAWIRDRFTSTSSR